MTSLLAEMFGTAGYLKESEPMKLLLSVKDQIEHLKVEAQNTLLEHYHQFLPCFTNTQQVEKKLVASTNQAEHLMKKLTTKAEPEMQSSICEIKSIKEEIKTLEKSVLLINQFKEIYGHIQDLSAAQLDNNYQLSAECYIQANTILNEFWDDTVEVKSVLQTVLILQREQLAFQLRNSWEKIISCCVCPEEESVYIRLIHDDAEHSHNIISALSLIKELDFAITNLSQLLLTLVFQPLLLYPHILEESMDMNQAILKIKFNKTQDKRPAPEICLETLKTILAFLNVSFLKVKINDLTIFERLGLKLGRRLSEQLVRDCLDYNVPMHSGDLTKYSEICSLSFTFNRDLIEMGFLKPDEKSALAATHNLEEFISNKLCQHFLYQARFIVKKDLYPFTHYSEEDKFKIPEIEGGRKPNLEETEVSSKQIISKMYSFPTCKISDSLFEFIYLLDEILEEAMKSTDILSLRYMCTSRFVCDIYLSLSYKYHEDNIEKLPQQAALFHNNCMYLANYLLILAHKYRNMQLPTLSDTHFTFVDLSPLIRRLGSEKFMNQMKQQKAILLEILNEEQVFESVAQDVSLAPKLEKVIKQCLYQFKLLKKVWIDVLPSHVYMKAMGTLINSTTEEIIRKVLNIDDISAKSSSTMATLFGTYIEEITFIFSIDSQQTLSNYILSWLKFAELKILLEANLKEIVDRWSLGKGILASKFSKEEVKSLIRALFQNTEKRAAALVQIR